MLSFKSFLIQEGGAGGHMAHPFDISTNGKELIGVFKEAIDFINSGKTSVKIDGINASLRLVEGKFVLDRGSAKPLDIKGIRPEDLEDRFGQGHGFVEKGKKIIDIFDTAYPKIKPELKKLGLLDNPNILFNTEYVEGKTNVVQYEGIDNFLAIHGLKEIKVNKTNPKTGVVTSRVASNISFDQTAMASLIKKLDEVAKAFGFKVLGNVGVTFKKNPDLTKVLAEKITLNEQTKTLGEWLKGIKISRPLITKKEYLQIDSSDKKGLSDKQISDYIIYWATIYLGEEILKNASSALGDLKNQEGIVLTRDDGSYYKITGKFFLRGMESAFQK
jgi:hypothetical protein